MNNLTAALYYAGKGSDHSQEVALMQALLPNVFLKIFLNIL